MINLLHILVPIVLIFFAGKELVYAYSSYKKSQKLSLLINNDDSEKKPTPKNTNKKTVAFEKIVAKNSVTINFLRRFQEESLWKIYAVIIGFSLFYIANQLFYFVDITTSTLLIILIFIIVAVIILPEKILDKQTDRRIRRISRDLPLIIDMMAIMVKSGMTVENGFRYLSTKVKPINNDVATILERACLMMDVNGIEQAIDLIQREVPSKEMRMFCITLRRSISYGNSIYDALLELSTEIRELQKLTIEEKIAAISAKMTLPMMAFILAPVLVIIAGPIILNLMDLFKK